MSTDEQTTANQRSELARLARARGLRIVHTYEEIRSGAATIRPIFDRMLADAHARHFDVLVVWAIDRFGRSLAGNLGDVMKLDSYGVKIVSARESWLELDGPARSLLVAVFSWVAEQERRRLIERTRAGLERARAAGVKIGRPRKRVDLEAHFAIAVKGLLDSLGRSPTRAEIAHRMGVSRATLNRALAKRRAERRASGRAPS